VHARPVEHAALTSELPPRELERAPQTLV